MEATAIAEAYTFSENATVVDLGGGQGTLLAALLSAHPSVNGVLFDQPTVVADAERVFTDAGVRARATIVAGDFFAKVPSGGDVYLLKSVLHNWADGDAERILQCCRRAMPQRARLLIAERLVPAGNAASEAKLFDINMLEVVGGRERTEQEYRELQVPAVFLRAKSKSCSNAVDDCAARQAAATTAAACIIGAIRTCERRCAIQPHSSHTSSIVRPPVSVPLRNGVSASWPAPFTCSTAARRRSPARRRSIGRGVRAGREGS